MSDIPELMRSISGEEIKTVEEREKFRRPEIINLFANFMYGINPFLLILLQAEQEEEENENFKRQTGACGSRFCGVSA